MMAEQKQVVDLEELGAAALREATNEFLGLIKKKLPLQFNAEERWPVVAHAFLARAASVLTSLTMLVEAEQEGDAQVMLRVLVELVTTFCWVAIAPKERVPEWEEWSSAQQLKLHNEAKLYGIEVLKPDQLKRLGTPKKGPPLPQMALEVDEYWPTKSPAFRPHPKDGPRHILTFTGAYTSIYRKGSDLVHSDVAALDRHLTAPIPGSLTVHIRERRSPTPDYPGLAIPMMGFVLIVFSIRFGWPEEKIVKGIMEGLLYRPDGTPKG